MPKTEQYICTRPKLVTELIKRGHKPVAEPSPWGDGKTVWIFDQTEDLKRIVNEFYKRIGKRSPFDIQDTVTERFTDKRGIEVRSL